jgi:hypothetical protein
MVERFVSRYIVVNDIVTKKLLTTPLSFLKTEQYLEIPTMEIPNNNTRQVYKEAKSHKYII